jgi:hypothetical protein
VIYADYVDTYKSRAVGSSGAGETYIILGGFLDWLEHLPRSIAVVGVITNLFRMRKMCAHINPFVPYRQVNVIASRAAVQKSKVACSRLSPVVHVYAVQVR